MGGMKKTRKIGFGPNEMEENANFIFQTIMDNDRAKWERMKAKEQRPLNVKPAWKMFPLTPKEKMEFDAVQKKFSRTPKQLRHREAVLWLNAKYSNANKAKIVLDAAKYGNADDRRRAAQLLGEFACAGNPEIEAKSVKMLTSMLHDHWDIKVSYAAVNSLKLIVERKRFREIHKVLPLLVKESKENIDLELRRIIREIIGGTSQR